MLSFLEPLIALSGAFSAALQFVVFGAFLLLILAPSIAALGAARPNGLLFRAPVLWAVPSVVAALAFGTALPEILEIGWAAVALVPYALWSVVVVVVGSPHVARRLQRFAVEPGATNTEKESRLSRNLYGRAAFVAGISLVVGAIVLGAVPLVAFAGALAVLGLFEAMSRLDEMTAPLEDTSVGRRIAHVTASALLALTGVPLIALTAMVLVGELTLGANNGTLLFVVLWIVALGSRAARRFAANPPSSTTATRPPSSKLSAIGA